MKYRRMKRRRQARRARKYRFDPEGSGYDYKTAREAGLGPDETKHWPSRDPRTGMLLKGKSHETWGLLEKGERQAGYEIYKGRDGRYYSRPKKRK